MRVKVYEGSVEECLPALEPESCDGMITDPPYGLGGHLTPDQVIAILTGWIADMGVSVGGRGFKCHSWDAQVPHPLVWKQCFRAMKPGAYGLVFAGQRTLGLVDIALRLAGFEVRDTVMWLYGCLSDDTEILVDGEWVKYDQAIAGRTALCYDKESDGFAWMPIQDLYTYDYCDTAYRIESASTDQVVSRNHRCLVERDGRYDFQVAEEAARKREARVPVLEDVRGLLSAVSLRKQGCHEASDLFTDSRSGVNKKEQAKRKKAAERASGHDPDSLCGVRSHGMETEGVGEARQATDMLVPMCGQAEGPGIGRSSVYIQAPRSVPADTRRGLSAGVQSDGQWAWSSARAQAGCCEDPRQAAASHRGRSSHKCGHSGQPAGESDALREPIGPPAFRGQGLTRPDLARITPFHYTGIVWCVRVPTGAFVARRNSKVFVTGNSGSPLKSMAMDLAVDKELGRAGDRPVIGTKRTNVGVVGGNYGNGGRTGDVKVTAPATPEAAAWEGYGTALRPGYEPCLLVMKPVAGSYAKTALEHGTGGLNLRGVMPGGGMPPDLLIDDWVAERLGDKAKYFPKASREERDAGCEALEARTFARVNPGGVSSDPRWAPTVVRNNHPCVKPLALTEWLSTLILPPAARTAGGTRRLAVPYCGSWSEIIGGALAGWDEVIGVELNRERPTKEAIAAGADPQQLVDAGYLDIGPARLAYWAALRGLEAPDVELIRGGAVAPPAPGVPGQLPLFA